MRQILFVCHANTCRSVMAHALLERMLRDEDGGRHIRVRSAGVGNVARDGMIPSLDARLVLREVGIHLAEADITSTDLHRHPHLLEESALVLTMTAQQKTVVEAFPQAAGRQVFTLREFAGEAGDVDDPVHRGEDAYRTCRDIIRRCLDRSLARLLDEAPRAVERR